MATIRYEVYSTGGTGGQTLQDTVDQAEGYANISAGDKLTTSGSWALAYQNTTKQDALAILRKGSADHVARIDDATPGNNAVAFSVEAGEIRKLLLRPGKSLYVKTES